MPAIHDNVFDAALGVVDNSTRVQVRTAGSSVLVDGNDQSPAITLDAGNFGSIGDYASGGRELQCLSSSGSDMKALDVTSAGAAKKVCIGTSATSVITVLVQASLASAISLAASDQVNLGTFKVIFKDPT